MTLPTVSGTATTSCGSMGSCLSNAKLNGSGTSGGARGNRRDQAPRELIDVAVRAACPIGYGFYGVDVKEADHGFIVMEVNDNPNLEQHGIEDQVGKDEIWTRVLKWFVERFEQ